MQWSSPIEMEKPTPKDSEQALNQDDRILSSDFQSNPNIALGANRRDRNRIARFPGYSKWDYCQLTNLKLEEYSHSRH